MPGIAKVNGSGSTSSSKGELVEKFEVKLSYTMSRTDSDVRTAAIALKKLSDAKYEISGTYSPTTIDEDGKEKKTKDGKEKKTKAKNLTLKNIKSTFGEEHLHHIRRLLQNPHPETHLLVKQEQMYTAYFSYTPFGLATAQDLVHWNAVLDETSRDKINPNICRLAFGIIDEFAGMVTRKNWLPTQLRGYLIEILPLIRLTYPIQRHTSQMMHDHLNSKFLKALQFKKEDSPENKRLLRHAEAIAYRQAFKVEANELITRIKEVFLTLSTQVKSISKHSTSETEVEVTSERVNAYTSRLFGISGPDSKSTAPGAEEDLLSTIDLLSSILEKMALEDVSIREDIEKDINEELSALIKHFKKNTRFEAFKEFFSKQNSDPNPGLYYLSKIASQSLANLETDLVIRTRTNKSFLKALSTFFVVVGSGSVVAGVAIAGGAIPAIVAGIIAAIASTGKDLTSLAEEQAKKHPRKVTDWEAKARSWQQHLIDASAGSTDKFKTFKSELGELINFADEEELGKSENYKLLLQSVTHLLEMVIDYSDNFEISWEAYSLRAELNLKLENIHRSDLSTRRSEVTNQTRPIAPTSHFLGKVDKSLLQGIREKLFTIEIWNRRRLESAQTTMFAYIEGIMCTRVEVPQQNDNDLDIIIPEIGVALDVVKAFLDHTGDVRTLLLEGESGVGKTSFIFYLTRKLWEEHSDYLPVIIPIGQENGLSDVETLINDESLRLKQEGKEVPKYLFIYDGYDEYRSHLNPVNRFLTKFPHSKALVTSRNQYLDSKRDFIRLFCPSSDTSGDSGKCLVFTLSRFEENLDMVETYLIRKKLSPSNRVKFKKLIKMDPDISQISLNPSVLEALVKVYMDIKDPTKFDQLPEVGTVDYLRLITMLFAAVEGYRNELDGKKFAKLPIFKNPKMEANTYSLAYNMVCCVDEHVPVKWVRKEDKKKYSTFIEQSGADGKPESPTNLEVYGAMGFISRKEEGRYGFLSEKLKSFFAARWIKRVWDYDDDLSTLKNQTIPKEVLQFFVALLEIEGGLKDGALDKFERELNGVAPSNKGTINGVLATFKGRSEL